MLSSQGYKLKKEDLSEEQIHKLMKDLTAKPRMVQGFGPNQVQIEYPIFLESKSSYYVPRFYGQREFGPVTTNKLGSGDEVITTPMTFCATANSVLYQGADVKFVDIDKKTLNINPSLIEEKINEHTKAIIPVDFRGHPADLAEINKIAKKYTYDSNSTTFLNILYLKFFKLTVIRII